MAKPVPVFSKDGNFIRSFVIVDKEGRQLMRWEPIKDAYQNRRLSWNEIVEAMARNAVSYDNPSVRKIVDSARHPFDINYVRRALERSIKSRLEREHKRKLGADQRQARLDYAQDAWRQAGREEQEEPMKKENVKGEALPLREAKRRRSC